MSKDSSGLEGRDFGALCGLRVLDFSHMIAGPIVTQLMAYNGAEVIKVESHRWFDGFRRRRGDEDINASRPYSDFNRNKLDVTLNLKHPDGIELAKRLVGMSDVVVENFSTDVMAKLGLSYEAISQIKADLIMVSITGMGQTGPYRKFVSWGPSAMAFSGMTYLWGHPELPKPVGSQTAHPDYMTVHALVALLTALHHRRDTGRGQHIELALIEPPAGLIGFAFAELSVNQREPSALGNVRGHCVPHNTYPCLDEDSWCAIVARTDLEWAALCALLGFRDWLEGPFATLLGRRRERALIDERISSWTRNRTAREVMESLQAVSVPASIVNSGKDLSEDPHLTKNGFLVDVPHPLMGTNQYAGIPARLSRTPAKIWRHAPLLGQDNDYVFRDLLGIGDIELKRLESSGAID